MSNVKVVGVICRCLAGFTSSEHLSDAVSDCVKLLSKARKSVHIVAGDLDAKVFEHPEVIEVLRNLATREENPVGIQILAGPNLDPQTVSLQRMAQEIPSVELVQLPMRPSGHFIVVDSKHTRIEEPHEPFSAEHKAYCAQNTFFLADRLEAEFAELKSLHISAQAHGRTDGR
jgi:hypothetical protein